MKYGMAVKALSLAVLGSGLLFSNAYAANSTSGSTTNGQMQMTSPSETARSAGEVYLEKNKLQPGVVTLPDGLQYKVLQEGQGKHPTDSDTVTVDYAGTLIDGTEFDSSYKRGQPATFPVSGVIPGWTEALKLMKAGSVWNLYIPASLAYGDHGAPPVIGPNQTLVFKVHLLSINREGST